MSTIFCSDTIHVRKLIDCQKDYNLFVKWLSDLDVCEYYEGRTKPFDYHIEYDNTAIGWIQFYTTEPGKYHECDVVDITSYTNSWGIDIVIGDKCFWNKGIGTQVMQLTAKYLFEEEKAGIIFIAPQTWNSRAIRCYEKSGFRQIKIIEKMELHDDEYKDGVLMVKTKDDQLI